MSEDVKGTISIIAGCSSSIEPLFAISFVRNVLSGTKFFEINPLFEEAAKREGFYKNEILSHIAEKGSLKGIKNIPQNIKRIFVTAFDIEPIEHLQIQATFQKYTDNAVSKTINLPEKATINDIRKIYIKAHELKCKGITVYRYGSKYEQVLSFGSKEKAIHHRNQKIIADSGYYSGCATEGCAF